MNNKSKNFITFGAIVFALAFFASNANAGYYCEDYVGRGTNIVVTSCDNSDQMYSAPQPGFLGDTNNYSGLLGSNTSNGNNNYNNGSNNQNRQTADAITKNPSYVGEYDATFTGFVSSPTAATVYFQYGKTSSLGLETDRRYVGTLSDEVRLSVGTLAPGTKYYYRIVVENQGGKSVGNIVSFTTREAVVVYTAQPQPTVTRVVTQQAPTTTVVRTVAPSTTTTVRSSEDSIGTQATIEGNNLAALSAFGYDKFLPDTILEWILVFFLILIIVIFGRMLVRKKADHH